MSKVMVPWICLSLVGSPVAGGAQPAIIPQPVKMEVREGFFDLRPGAAVAADLDLADKARQLADYLAPATGWPLEVVEKTPQREATIRFVHVPAIRQSYGEEAYRLKVSMNGIVIEAATPNGAFYAIQTLRQLLPSAVFSTTQQSDAVWRVPCVEILDYPRFRWRGLLVDVARHYMPPDFLKKMVDLLALHKMNRLQLHLTDDQGWRVEIRKYPRLTQIGSLRKESPMKGDRNRGDGKPYGPYFYTQEQLRDLVSYAQARHVTIVPEIEMPGHFLAALTAYPEFSCRGGPFEVRTRWGIEPDILCPGNEQAVAFVQDILSEIVEIFPSPFIHIGGDEAPRDRWKKCPKCQARMSAEGLKTEAQLQTYLNRRVEAFLASRGRRLIGWDEILEGGLTSGATVMSWRGTAGGIAAAKAGHDVVMSPTSHCYFDYAQAQGPGEPECIGGFIPLNLVYAFEPIPADLPPAQHKYILGAQGNVWTEFLWTPQDVEYFAFPRASALAEVVWSPAKGRDLNNFRRRLEPHLERLDQLDVNYRKPDSPQFSN